MASLPKDRLQGAAPFSKVGVDYFAPITVKHLRKQEKRYGCLFTCLVTRAVHLEVARSLETDSFINALRRLIARRGSRSDIYSDNGTNFVGAHRELKQSLEQWKPVPDRRLPVSEGFSVALQSSCPPPPPTLVGFGNDWFSHARKPSKWYFRVK